MIKFVWNDVAPFLLGMILTYGGLVFYEYLTVAEIVQACDKNGIVELNGTEYVCFEPHPDAVGD